MYIAPNSTIKLLHNVPLDTTFQHTIYFANRSSQETYFNTKVKYTFNQQTYQRARKGSLRIQRKADDLYDCNYLMFQNTSFGNKWFYAFVTGVDYVNNVTSEISYVLDVMQTWLPSLDYTLERSFVEREHSATDVVGDNILPEPVPLGDYITNPANGEISGEITRTKLFDDLAIIFETTGKFRKVGSTWSYNPDFAGGVYSNDYYSGNDYTAFDATVGSASLWANIQQMCACVARWQDNINRAYMCPLTLINGGIDEYHGISPFAQLVHHSFTVNNIKTGALNGYTPRNKKLYTYPFNLLSVSNLQGNEAVYKYEYFTSNNCLFIITGTFIGNPSAYIMPTSYKSNGIVLNENEVLTLDGWGEVPWIADVYNAWLAQSKLAVVGAAASLLTQNVMNGYINPIMSSTGKYLNEMAWYLNPNTNIVDKMILQHYPKGGLMGDQHSEYVWDTPVRSTPNMNNVKPMNGVGNSVSSNIGNMIGDGIVRSINPIQSRGNKTGQILYTQDNKLDFYFMNKVQPAQYLKIADDYFDMFGYSTKELKVPNINVRPHWCFTKTVGCVVTGSIPADDMKAICDIYDNGITFWKYGNEVGHYELDNTV